MGPVQDELASVVITCSVFFAIVRLVLSTKNRVWMYSALPGVFGDIVSVSVFMTLTLSYEQLIEHLFLMIFALYVAIAILAASAYAKSKILLAIGTFFIGFGDSVVGIILHLMITERTADNALLVIGLFAAWFFAKQQVEGSLKAAAPVDVEASLVEPKK